MAMTNADKQRRYRERKAEAAGRTIGLVGRPVSSGHGTPTRYNSGCRCEACTAANTAKGAAYRANR